MIDVLPRPVVKWQDVCLVVADKVSQIFMQFRPKNYEAENFKEGHVIPTSSSWLKMV